MNTSDDTRQERTDAEIYRRYQLTEYARRNDMRNVLARAEHKQRDRRFTGQPITGFGGLAK